MPWGIGEPRSKLWYESFSFLPNRRSNVCVLQLWDEVLLKPTALLFLSNPDDWTIRKCCEKSTGNKILKPTHPKSPASGAISVLLFLSHQPSTSTTRVRGRASSRVHFHSTMLAEEETLCDVCSEKVRKYKCPRCFVGTCSLACCKEHKRKVMNALFTFWKEDFRIICLK